MKPSRCHAKLLNFSTSFWIEFGSLLGSIRKSYWRSNFDPKSKRSNFRSEIILEVQLFDLLRGMADPDTGGIAGPADDHAHYSPSPPFPFPFPCPFLFLSSSSPAKKGDSLHLSRPLGGPRKVDGPQKKKWKSIRMGAGNHAKT